MKVVRTVPVRTSAEMAQALKQEFVDADVLIMAAAVSDFAPTASLAEYLAEDPEIDQISGRDLILLLGGLFLLHTSACCQCL